MSKLPTKKQLRAYYLVEVMGESHAEAAKLMGICRSAVSGLLTRFHKGVRENKGPPAETISLPGDCDDQIKEIF